MSILESVDLTVNGQPLNIKVFNSQESNQILNGKIVNIFASGPSVKNVDFIHSRLNNPSIFVNGSLSLIAKYNFCNIVGYVISDARFIKNNPEVLIENYKGQNLYATISVYESIAIHLPELMTKYYRNMRVIFPVDRSLIAIPKTSLLKPLLLAKRLICKKTTLLNFAKDPNFVINLSHKPQPIGVSLDVTSGFVEAGTVAYVATQLAFSLGAIEINLYGIDLLNSNQPRFYETQDNAAPCKLDKAITDRIVPSFNLLGNVYKQRGVTVINHSPISKHLFI